MKLRMPDLQVGKTYNFNEIRQYMASHDESLVGCDFPRSHRNWPLHDSFLWRNSEPIVLEYQEFVPDEILIEAGLDPPGESWTLEYTYQQFCRTQSDLERVELVKSKLISADVAFGVFTQWGDTRRRVTEGTHRAVAMWLLKAERIPVFLMKYANWEQLPKGSTS